MSTNVWKIASHWGHGGSSLLEMFFYYGCVFFNRDDASKIGAFHEVKRDDLFLICKGDRPVAVARAKDQFRPYNDSQNRIRFTPVEVSQYAQGDLYICCVEIAHLPEEKRKWELYHPKPRSRFCGIYKGASNVRKAWEDYQPAKQNEFNILCQTATLQAPEGAATIFSKTVRYRVPVYQRPYSWGENELQKLLENLKHSFRLKEPVFMGTMQLSKPIPLDVDGENKLYDVIDGQQRLTTFTLLIQLLKAMAGMPYNEDDEKILGTHVNRGASQRELNEFWQKLKKIWKQLQTESVSSLIDEVTLASNIYLNNLKRLRENLVEQFNDDDAPTPETWEALLSFIKEKVQVVVIETHAGISRTITIFNTINTTGLDLGAEDLFKLRFYEYRMDRRICQDDSDVFDEISKIYEKVEDRKREKRAKHSFSMNHMLATYQRVLIARHGLNSDTYKMAPQHFFDCLFDTALHIHHYSDFAAEMDPARNPDGQRLSIDDLTHLFKCYDDVYKMLDEREDLRIFHNFILTTRYHHQAWDCLVIIKYFHPGISDDELVQFAEEFFKFLVLPSLAWSKIIKSIQGLLHQFLRAIPDTTKMPLEILRGITNQMLAEYNEMKQWNQSCCEGPIAHNKIAKFLLCRLCEYHAGQRSADVLFREGVDIEHIQPYLDKNKEQREAIWEEWGDEINSLGNLMLLEQELNRSIGNDQNKKAKAYPESKYIIAKELAGEVNSWSREKAETRKNKLVKKVMSYLFTTPTIVEGAACNASNI